jgi:hypothetical protein
MSRLQTFFPIAIRILTRVTTREHVLGRRGGDMSRGRVVSPPSKYRPSTGGRKKKKFLYYIRMEGHAVQRMDAASSRPFIPPPLFSVQHGLCKLFGASRSPGARCREKVACRRRPSLMQSQPTARLIQPYLVFYRFLAILDAVNAWAVIIYNPGTVCTYIHGMYRDGAAAHRAYDSQSWRSMAL